MPHPSVKPRKVTEVFHGGGLSGYLYFTIILNHGGNWQAVIDLFLVGVASHPAISLIHYVYTKDKIYLIMTNPALYAHHIRFS